MQRSPIISIDSAISQLIQGWYTLYHNRNYLKPDPLQMLEDFAPEDHEAAGLLASSLALGRVESILSFLHKLFAQLGAAAGVSWPPVAADKPWLNNFLQNASPGTIANAVSGLGYRFFDTECLAGLLCSLHRCLKEHGSLGNAFFSCVDTCPAAPDYRYALGAFAGLLRKFAGRDLGILIPKEDTGTAYKRLALFLRWMIRHDVLDPGCWHTRGSRARLIVPLDTHVVRLARSWGWISSDAATMSNALAVTARLACIDPEDPVRFDFCISRQGIHPLLRRQPQDCTPKSV